MSRDLSDVPPPSTRPRTSSARSFSPFGRGIDQHGALADGPGVAFANLSAQHGHFGHAGFHQPSAAQARGLAARRHLHFQIELVALANARRQVAAHQHQRRGGRGQQLIRILHADRLQLVQQCGTLGRGRGIRARVVQARYQRHRLDFGRAYGRTAAPRRRPAGCSIPARRSSSSGLCERSAGAAHPHRANKLHTSHARQSFMPCSVMRFRHFAPRCPPGSARLERAQRTPEKNRERVSRKKVTRAER